MEKEVYLTKFQIVILSLVVIFLTVLNVVLYLSGENRNIIYMILTLVFVYILFLAFLYAYKRKIPIYAIKER